MFDFIPQIIILVAIVVVIIIIIKKFPEASKYSDKSGKEGGVETLGVRVLSVIKYIGKRIRIFSVSIVGGIFAGIKKARKKTIKSKDINKEDMLSDLVQDKPDLGQEDIATGEVEREVIRETKEESEEDKVIDLLEEAAEELGSGNYKEAESNYIKVVTIDPKNTRAYKGLGKIYRKQDNKKDAIASFEQVLKIDPNDSETIEELEKLKSKK
ncbi:MAG: tetratricopeptide repeat protein [Parcubacteria group bacterium]|nr:tetratricopeptide repeat protein [Parcubacteria group bacterium]